MSTRLPLYPIRFPSVLPWDVLFGASSPSSVDDNTIGVDCFPRVTVSVRTTLSSSELEHGIMRTLVVFLSPLSSVIPAVDSADRLVSRCTSRRHHPDGIVFSRRSIHRRQTLG